jgi:hypothetical protein
VFLSQREWTDPNGLFRPARCLSIKPNANGMYVVDTDDKEMSALKIAVLAKAVEAGTDPVIGPFDSVEAAIISERKVRPLTDKEKVAQAEADSKELEVLRREKADRKTAGTKLA